MLYTFYFCTGVKKDSNPLLLYVTINYIPEKNIFIKKGVYVLQNVWSAGHLCQSCDSQDQT